MIDLTLIALTVAAALGYRWLANKQSKNHPELTEGPLDYSRMPEMNFVQPLEAREFNASKFMQMPGSGVMVGAFSQDVKSI
jgi:hypothetical protein